MGRQEGLAMDKYTNQELVESADAVAKNITDGKRSNHHRDKFFPEIIDRLNLKIGVEIGVDKAGFSNHILDKTKIERYYCVDTWQDDFGSDYRPDYFAKDGNVRYNEAREVLQPYIDEERVAMLRMTGMHASTLFPAKSIDFCYIDGDHSLEGIYTDIKAWLPKVKIGGIIAGHDYKDGPKSGISDFWGKQLDFCVKTVVDYYANRYGHKLNVVGGRIKSWWFIKNCETVDHVEAHLLQSPSQGVANGVQGIQDGQGTTHSQA
jgi:hypothetical protein